MSTWLMAHVVPAGTCEWAAQTHFQWAAFNDKGEDIERLGKLMYRHSEWIGGGVSTPKLYKAMKGLPESEPPNHLYNLWDQVEDYDPHRLALIGGNLLVIEHDHKGRRDHSRRLSTSEEAALALEIMEETGAQLERGEAALLPFKQVIRAYLDFYRSIQPGEELSYGHTGSSG